MYNYNVTSMLLRSVLALQESVNSGDWYLF